MFKQFIETLARHPVGSHLLMCLLILSGAWAAVKLNVQFLPNFNIEVIQIELNWKGASSEDMMQSVIHPIEEKLKGLSNVKHTHSIAKFGEGNINIEFRQGTNMQKAIDDVRNHVQQVRKLPIALEKPRISQIENNELIAKLLISGPLNRSSLRKISQQFKNELLHAGISQVISIGLPRQEIRIHVTNETLVRLNTTLSELAELIKSQSTDQPAGIIQREDNARQLRIENQARDLEHFKNLLISIDNKTMRLGDLASELQLLPRTNEPLVYSHGKPAIELRLLRNKYDDALQSAKILHKWLIKAKKQYPDLNLKLYDEKWLYIKGRIQLLIKNGLSGLLLIIVVLYLLLNQQIAFWVIAGIPTALFAALAILYSVGGSINMVSLFAFIMTLGIIVDDTIVVGEETLNNLQRKCSPITAILQACDKMLQPILSSSLTTIAAFLPLFFINGIIGTILFDIPLVVISVILASIFECFFILPSHLYHSLKKQAIYLTQSQQKFHHYMDSLKNRFYRKCLLLAIRKRKMTFLIMILLFLISISLIVLGLIRFNFFPSPDGQLLVVNAKFIHGTPENTLKQFAHTLENTLKRTVDEFAIPDLIKTDVIYLKYQGVNQRQTERGEERLSYVIELNSTEDRDLTNQTFINHFKKNLSLPPGLESFNITTPKSGPPGKDIDLEIHGEDMRTLKAASEAIQSKLSQLAGVSAIKDDMPYGQSTWILKLNANGHQLGLTANDLGRQFFSAFSGELIQIYHQNEDEIEVRISLPKSARNQVNVIDTFPIKTPNGKILPFSSLGFIETKSSPNQIRHSNGKLALHVTAEVNPAINNHHEIISKLKKTFLEEVMKKNHVTIRYRGKAEEQSEAFKDMKYGLLFGMILIFMILAAIFESYVLPLVVMSTIPLGITGAIFGHLILRIDLTLLSLFGLFGLSGIVINNAIILVNEFLHHHEGSKIFAIRKACQNRLRAVLLTSLTTIVGLTPLLFERSTQAQFLIPMATSICFGLAYAALLILFFIPALLYTVASFQNEKQ